MLVRIILVSFRYWNNRFYRLNEFRNLNQVHFEMKTPAHQHDKLKITRNKWILTKTIKIDFICIVCACVFDVSFL